MKEQQDWLLQCRANVANALKEGAKAEVNYKPYFFDVVWPLLVAGKTVSRISLLEYCIQKRDDMITNTHFEQEMEWHLLKALIDHLQEMCDKRAP